MATPVVHTADIDNLSKFVMDVLEKCGIIENDTWIMELWATKALVGHGERGYTEISLEDNS